MHKRFHVYYGIACAMYHLALLLNKMPLNIGEVQHLTLTTRHKQNQNDSLSILQPELLLEDIMTVSLKHQQMGMEDIVYCW